jgi:hypothetical protein
MVNREEKSSHKGAKNKWTQANKGIDFWDGFGGRRRSAAPPSPKRPIKRWEEAMGDILGYARVSTTDQDLDGQRHRLRAAGAIRIFDDIVSGRTFERTGLAGLLDYYLIQDGIETDATILEYIGNKGGTLYGRVIPMHKHLVEIQGEKHVLILQNHYMPGKIKLRWVPDRHINDAVVLTDTGTYTILDVLGGPPRIVAFILQAGVLMLFLGGLPSLFGSEGGLLL